MKYVMIQCSSNFIVGYGSIPIHTIFRGMNIHKSQLFWCELQGYKGFDTLPVAEICIPIFGPLWFINVHHHLPILNDGSALTWSKNHRLRATEVVRGGAFGIPRTVFFFIYWDGHPWLWWFFWGYPDDLGHLWKSTYMIIYDHIYIYVNPQSLIYP